MTKIFLLGVGCQKGGTTWLHEHLKAYPAVNMGFAKEYHVFDALTVPECHGFRDAAVERVRALAAGPQILAPEHEDSFRLLEFYRNPQRYFDYFQTLALADPRTRLTGDITPSYAALSAETLAGIRAGLEARGFAVRVVFLMRDPVERIISAVRMMIKNDSRAAGGPGPGPEAELAEILRYYPTPDCAIRSRYQDTIENLDSVFDPESVHYLFYEDMFNTAVMRPFIESLGLDYRPGDFGDLVNVSRNSNPTPVAVRKTLHDHYAPTYAAVEQRFGPERIAGIWRRY
ncbi:sulfotransferase [Caulobacter sp. B11]|uniref:sulfotransferase n=1 Tax=Caulobacter sp. B11 TaxID=2048899 RepID=UPI0013747636|nr:sulfotransferase [Caulobacter sp. B11]